MDLPAIESRISLSAHVSMPEKAIFELFVPSGPDIPFLFENKHVVCDFLVVTVSPRLSVTCTRRISESHSLRHFLPYEEKPVWKFLLEMRFSEVFHSLS